MRIATTGDRSHCLCRIYSFYLSANSWEYACCKSVGLFDPVLMEVKSTGNRMPFEHAVGFERSISLWWNS